MADTDGQLSNSILRTEQPRRDAPCAASQKHVGPAQLSIPMFYIGEIHDGPHLPKWNGRD